MEPTTFGALLKRYRMVAGLTQEALAERANLSTRAVSDLERGLSRTPRYDTLDQLARAMNLEASQRSALFAAARPSLLNGDAKVDPSHALHLLPTALMGREVAPANVILEEALGVVRADEMTLSIANILTLLGHLARQQQDFERAKERFRESLAIYQRLGNATYIAWCLEGIATVSCAQGRYEGATRLCAAAASLRAEAQLSPSEQEEVDKVMLTAREALDERAYAEAWRMGSTMTQEDAIAYALQGLPAGSASERKQKGVR